MSFVTNVQFTSTRSLANFTHGVHVAGSGTTAIFFDGCEFLGNSRRSGSTAAGVQVDSTSGFAVRNSHLGQGYGFSSQKYGLRVTGSSDNYIVTSNLFYGNTTANLSDSGSGSNKVIANNLS